ncbi:hypothetical protein MAPG_06670 [Magnaporthiopsis poae ATCC 64411]|uniref:Uncharacterized protein n=1 Tax=Magnaporthiopsis poae (strain ATCC 64411 / 73-15) TaxID=644358 RepID=A0A0C4E2N0_MAGP6|nr:hypothetical protein MAPG_06670 [Magnaporthiopsis poae ATCC 64411]
MGFFRNAFFRSGHASTAAAKTPAARAPPCRGETLYLDFALASGPSAAEQRAQALKDLEKLTKKEAARSRAEGIKLLPPLRFSEDALAPARRRCQRKGGCSELLPPLRLPPPALDASKTEKKKKKKGTSWGAKAIIVWTARHADNWLGARQGLSLGQQRSCL